MKVFHLKASVQKYGRMTYKIPQCEVTIRRKGSHAYLAYDSHGNEINSDHGHPIGSKAFMREIIYQYKLPIEIGNLPTHGLGKAILNNS